MYLKTVYAIIEEMIWPINISINIIPFDCISTLISSIGRIFDQFSGKFESIKQTPRKILYK